MDWSNEKIIENINNIIIRSKEPTLLELNKNLYVDTLIKENKEFYNRY